MINTDTRVLGILGNPLAHSLSPAMHNRALNALGLNYVYVAFRVDETKLAEAVQAIRALGIAGVNITIPFKETIMAYLDELSPEARACGAVNVVKNHAGKLVGYNTDGPGFVASLREAGVVPAGKKVVVLGAGGAARAVTWQLAEEGARSIVIINRTISKGQRLATLVMARTGVRVRSMGWERDETAAAIRTADLLINTTPVGMYPHTGKMPPVAPEWLHQELLVADVVYNPVQTRLLAAAEARGLKTINGVGMFVHQGALAFQLFTGEVPPVRIMREVVENQLAGRNKG